jgi:hypothetical protein
MSDPSPRRVRLARGASATSPVAGGTADGPLRRVANRAGTERARRLALLFVVVLAALYLGFSVAARGAPGGSSAGARSDLEIFGGVALLTAVAGAGVTLLSAPAAIEFDGGITVIVSAFGTRRTFGPGPSASVRVVRRFRAGWLSSRPVESVEISAGPIRRTYLLEAGILPEPAERAA